MASKTRTANVTKYVSPDGDLVISVHQRQDNDLWQLTSFLGCDVSSAVFSIREAAELWAEKVLLGGQPEELVSTSTQRYEVAPVHTRWGVWDSLTARWATFFSATVEDLTFDDRVAAEAKVRWMNTAVGLD